MASNKCLLVTCKGATGNPNVYLEDLSALGSALRRDGSAKKVLHFERMGNQLLFAFEENKRRLAVCSLEKVSFTIKSWRRFCLLNINSFSCISLDSTRLTRSCAVSERQWT